MRRSFGTGTACHGRRRCSRRDLEAYLGATALAGTHGEAAPDEGRALAHAQDARALGVPAQADAVVAHAQYDERALAPEGDVHPVRLRVAGDVPERLLR